MSRFVETEDTYLVDCEGGELVTARLCPHCGKWNVLSFGGGSPVPGLGISICAVTALAECDCEDDEED